MPRLKKEINEEIGARVRAGLMALHLTRDEFASKTHYSANFIQEVELGRSGLSSESIKVIAEALGVTADNLLFGTITGFENIVRKLQEVPADKLPLVEDIITKLVECSK